MLCKASDDVLKINIFDAIGEDESTAKAIVSQIESAGKVKEIRVRLNSMGGLCSDGIAIYNALKSHPAKVIVTIEGMACSAASVIAMAGDEIVMATGTLIMVHNPWIETAGGGKHLRRQADMLDSTRDSLATIYQTKTGLSRDRILSIMDNETWLSATESLSLGFATKISSEDAVYASYDYSKLGSVPGHVLSKLTGKPVAKSKAQEDDVKPDGEAAANAEEDEEEESTAEEEEEAKAKAEEDNDDPLAELDEDDEKDASSTAKASALIKKYSKTFGSRATVYLGKGLSYAAACEKHIAALNTVNSKVRAERDAALAEVSEVKAQMKLLATGAKRPLNRAGQAPSKGAAPKSLADVVSRMNAR